MSHLSSFCYVEVEGEIHETPFQAFEVVQVIKAPQSEENKLVVQMSSLKDAKAVVDVGHPEGWVVCWISLPSLINLALVSDLL